MSRFKGSTRAPARQSSPSQSRGAAVLPNSGTTPSVPPPTQDRIADAKNLAPLATAANPFRRLAFYALLVLVFVRFSFLHEILALTFNIRSYLPLVFGTLVVIGTTFTGGLPRSLRSRGIIFWIAYATWLALATLFSSWRGGSTAVISSYYMTNFTMIFAIAGLVVTWREFVWLLYAIGAAGVVNELTMRWMGGSSDNRLTGGVVTIGNSNDFAAHMLVILPIMWFIAAQPQVPRPLRGVMWAAMAYGLFQIFSTGSRGALVALMAAALILFWKASLTGKVLVLAGTGVAVAAFIALLPGAVISRYQTIFDSDPSLQNSEATLSTSERMLILEDSISLTLRNPLFGVGPGEFGDVNGFETKAKGRKDFSVTHNSYTQTSSEAGIPALLFFLGGVVSMWRVTNSVLKRARAGGNLVVERAACALVIAIGGFSVAAFFLTFAYLMYFPVLAGLGMACANVADHELCVRADGRTRSPDPRFPAIGPALARI